MVLDPFGQEIRDFMSKIAVAKSSGQNEIECSPEIIKHYNPQGLGGAEYFIYQDVFVYPVGKSELIKKDMQIPLATRLHGDKAGVILNG